MAQKYNEKVLEPEVLELWKKNQTYPKLKQRNKGKQSYYFLEGPPYTSGKVHIGHAWNLALKDTLLRYKRMQGFDVFDRWGYDMHGLPTEHATEKKLGISGKAAIQQFGVAKFIEECEKLSIENMKGMNEDFARLGGWFDYENAYMPITQEYIEGEWWLVKKAHEKKRLYEGERAMAWCSSCATACAKHELEYKKIRDNSIYEKLKLKDSDNEYLVIWTTTPWTIPFNLAVMVHPEFEYVKAKVDNEIWIVAKELVDEVIVNKAEKGYEILETFPGKKLEGLQYESCFGNDIPQIEKIQQECPKAFTVVLSEEFVDVQSGTGLVHCAPGCGPEDYEVGHRNGIKPFNTLNEHGIFEHIPLFNGLIAKTDDKKFIEKIDEKGALVANTPIEHDYAHCWRCKNPIVYKTTKQWFFKVEDIKEEMIKENDGINWVPQSAYNAFDSWLKNLRDNSITKQRYWGTPLPIWKCESESCNHYEVFDKVDDIEQKSGQKLKNLHKPWIDEIEMPCTCGKTMKRIHDILDVWVDAGSASWNALDFPKKTEQFDKLFPADFILEGIDQIRGWFNLLHVASMIVHGKASFKACYMHGFINDAKGRKMSKSIGNYILPSEVVDQYGADTLRYYMIGGANPGLDLNYNFEDMKLKYRNLMLLWNVQNYLLDFAKQTNVNPAKLEYEQVHKHFDVAEQYILSKVQSTTRKLTDLYESYHLNETPLVVEELFFELSRTYIQLVREKTTTGAKEEKEAVLYALYQSFSTIVTLFAPTAPFICEKMYQNLKEAFNLQEESVHHLAWPKVVSHLLHEELETHMKETQDIIAASLNAREKAKKGVRWPLQKLIVATKVKHTQEAVKKLSAMIGTQVNVKEIEVVESFPHCTTTLIPNKGMIGKDFAEHAAGIINTIEQMDQEDLLTKLDVNKKVNVKTDHDTFEIKKQHLTITQHVHEPYVLSECKNGMVFLDTTSSDALEAEGFARELTRRVQALRKKAGMVKQDEITLYVQAQAKIDHMLEPWIDHIKGKVGAKEFILVEKDIPDLEHKSSEKIKDKEFHIALERV